MAPGTCPIMNPTETRTRLGTIADAATKSTTAAVQPLPDASSRRTTTIRSDRESHLLTTTSSLQTRPRKHSFQGPESASIPHTAPTIRARSNVCPIECTGPILDPTVPRSMWRGAISFGMVAIPVRLYLATESKSVSFRLLCPNDHTPVRNKRWCPEEDREIGWSEALTRLRGGQGRVRDRHRRRPRQPAVDHDAHHRHRRVLPGLGDRGRRVSQERVLPGTGGCRRQAVRPAAPGAREDRHGRHRQDRAPRSRASLPSRAA